MSPEITTLPITTPPISPPQISRFRRTHLYRAGPDRPGSGPPHPRSLLARLWVLNKLWLLNKTQAALNLGNLHLRDLRNLQIPDSA
jgi:hypothetical protein